ncbi:FAD-dependent monooxygenase [Promicromonospora sp. NPDC057488]|uniref:FAD-dependent monooxygenase n=1 Tax=Promicromonospora sp. NPDC057488 TaxID=3346147 RepID=UPI00367085E6
MNKPRALVVGMGIGGLATALRLHDVGWESVLVERAPERRGAGYFVAMFGSGTSAAERLGVLDTIGDRTSPGAITYDVERDGRRRPGMGYGDVPGAPRLLLRGDIESALYNEVAPLADLFDSVHQVVMPSWHTDRVVLVGDSAWCVTLYSGMGASSAIAGADLLGTVLQRNPGNPGRALREWEMRLRPFIATHQELGRQELVTFIPQTRRDKRTRTIMQTLLGNPTGKRVMQRILAPKFRPKAIDVAAA